MTRRRWLLALLLLAAAAPHRVDAQEGARDCSVPAELIADVDTLPLLAARLKEKKPVTIVAIGGSSTAGGAAPTPEQAYPERLQGELLRRHAGIPIKVLNKGVPRQTAEEMVRRFDKDVFAENPVLVIWETGTTEAVRGMDVEAFAAALENGISALQDRHIEVMLVDMQYSRRTASIIGFERYLEAMQRTAELDGVTLFHRFEIMRYWSDNGVFNFDDVKKGERSELAASVYSCLAQRLADTIDHAVE